jgi:hypothetical protein
MRQSDPRRIDTIKSAAVSERGPVLLCYDGSDPARRAIERAGQVVGGGEAIVLTAWESLGSAILRNLPSHGTTIGREARRIAEDVVEDLDASTAEVARATAGEGAELAATAGFDARPLARRAVARAAERTAVTVWRTVLDVADDEGAELIGARQPRPLGSQVHGARQRLLRRCP